MSQKPKGFRLNINLSRRSRIVLASLVTAITVGWLIGGAFSPKPAKPLQPVEVVIAKMPIPERTEIAAEMIGIAGVPDAPPGALRQVADAVGRFARRPIELGEIITGDVAVAAEDLPVAIPQGALVYTLTLGADQLFGGKLHPGSRVDIIASMPAAGGRIARVVASGVLVLDAPDLRRREQGTPGATRASPPAGTEAVPQGGGIPVTLAVPAETITELALAQTIGILFLALRPPGTEGIPPAPQVSTESLEPQPMSTGKAQGTVPAVIPVPMFPAQRGESPLGPSVTAREQADPRQVPAAGHPAPGSRSPSELRKSPEVPLQSVEVILGEQRVVTKVPQADAIAALIMKGEGEAR